jgi:hypothetical protein
VLIGIGVILRAYNFPAPYEQRDSDEVGYVQSSLSVLEGSVPGFKAAPAGPQIWLGWGYAAAKSARYLIAPTAEERASAMALRPYVALNHAIFDCYREMGGMRIFEIAVTSFVSIGSIWAAYRLGMIYAGFAGGVLVGGLTSVLPLFVNLSTQSRPYSLAWSFGIFSLFLAAKNAASARWVLSACLLGLSIAARIEMLCILPFVVGEYALANAGNRIRLTWRVTLLSLVVLCAVAPWFPLSLVGNLKTIVAVRFIGTPDTMPSPLQTITEIAIAQGLLLAIVLLPMGVGCRSQDQHRRAWLVCLAILLALTMLRSTGYGLQHQGPAVLILVIYSAIGLRCIGERWPRAALPIAIAALLLSLTQSLRMIHANRQEYVPADATDWIERNVPAGATVYWCPGLARLPLPTPEAADAIWRPLSDPHAYERKLQWGTGRMGTAVSEPPRVLGEGPHSVPLLVYPRRQKPFIRAKVQCSHLRWLRCFRNARAD